jgi:hypothetical protein
MTSILHHGPGNSGAVCHFCGDLIRAGRLIPVPTGGPMAAPTCSRSCAAALYRRYTEGDPQAHAKRQAFGRQLRRGRSKVQRRKQGEQ